MHHLKVVRLVSILAFLALGIGLLPLNEIAIAAAPPQTTYIRFKRNTSNIFVALCINAADNHRRTRIELRADGSTIWQLVDTRGSLNGCVEGVLYFSEVVGGEHLVVNIEAWNGTGSTSSRFDLFPSGSDQLNNCSVQTDSKSPLIRDPRYRWDTAAGLACAFVDPVAVGQATAPAAPGNPIATTITQNSVSMSWSDNSSNEDGFKIYRWDAPDPGWMVVGTAGANNTTFTATGLACNTRYYFNVNAYNGYGETPAPSEGWLNVTTSACEEPQPVTNCDGGEGVYLYEHDDFSGRCHKVTSDSASAASWSIGHDTASSIKFVGEWTARVYEHDSYQGTSSFFNQDDANFGDDAINHDRASSIRVYKTTATSDFKCEQLGAGFNAVVDGICVKYQAALISGVSGLNTVISVADLRNPNIKVELAHELAPNQTDLFKLKTTEDFVKQNSVVGSNNNIQKYYVAISGTAIKDECSGDNCSTKSDDSVLGINRTVYDVTTNEKTPSFLTYSYNDTLNINRRDYDYRKGDYNYIREQIQRNQFAIGYNALILDVGNNYMFEDSDASLGIRDDVGFHPKVAIGISEDGTKLYFAASRLNQMVASEMAKSLKEAGAYRAILLDCGRTTQFRGFTDKGKSLWLNGYAPFFSERKIINSIVVYNDARTTQQSANVSSNGGSYLLSPSTEISFEVGTFSGATTISYTPQFPKATEGFDHIGRFFSIESTVNNAEVQPLKEYRITLAYDEEAVSPEVESQLALYHWNGFAWEKEPSSVVNIEDNTITASPNHFSEWAILAPNTEKLYLPLIRR